jgi:hypothetical protein
MLFNGQTLARHWHNTKKMVGNTWNHAVKLGQQLDHGMHVGKKLLGAITPLLDQFGAGHHVKPIMSGIKAYDQGRADVMYGVHNVQAQYDRIRRQVPEIGL